MLNSSLGACDRLIFKTVVTPVLWLNYIGRSPAIIAEQEAAQAKQEAREAKIKANNWENVYVKLGVIPEELD